MTLQRGKLVSGGRLQIPADVRKLLGLKDGDSVTMEVVDGKLHVRPYREVIAEIQTRMKAFLPAGISLADELIADRRAAAESE
jgi:antitoxin PrlF